MFSDLERSWNSSSSLQARLQHWTLVIFRSKFTSLEKEFPSPQHNPGASCYLLFLQLVRRSCSFPESPASTGRESLPLGPGDSPAVSCKSLPDPSSLLASSPVPLPPGTPLSEQSGGRDFSRFEGKWIWQRSTETSQFVHPSFFPYLFPSSQDKYSYEGPGSWISLSFCKKIPPSRVDGPKFGD